VGFEKLHHILLILVTALRDLKAATANTATLKLQHESDVDVAVDVLVLAEVPQRRP
jgi:hypothetical protein